MQPPTESFRAPADYKGTCAGNKTTLAAMGLISLKGREEPLNSWIFSWYRYFKDHQGIGEQW